MILGEPTTLLIVLGTLLVVAGIVLISWKPERQLASFRLWHLLLPIGAAFLTGMNHPIRRYVLTMANEPLFFSALMGTCRSAAFLFIWRCHRDRSGSCGIVGALAVSCHRGMRNPSILFIITAISMGRVVIVAPIAASYPVWSLICRRIFLRDVESINWKVVAGILSVVAGNFAIHLGR